MKGPSNQTSTVTNTLDPTVAARQTQLFNTAAPLADAPFQPYRGEAVAPTNNDMLASYQAARAASLTGQPQIQAGNDTYGKLTAFDPTAIDPSMAGATPGATANAPLVNTKNFTDYDIAKYMNPFIGNVVDTTLSDIDRQRLRAIQSGDSAAAAAGAFGGTRQGVTDALTNDMYGRTSAATAAQLRSKGFEDASGLITGDANRDVGAQATNAQTGLAASTTNAGLFSDLAKFNAAQKQAAAAENQQAGIAGAGVRGNAAAGLIGGGTAAQAAAGKGSDLLNRIGLQQQAGKQNQDTFDYQQWQQQQQDPYSKLSWLNGFTGTPTTNSTTTTPTNSGSPFGQVLGAAATVLPFLL